MIEKTINPIYEGNPYITIKLREPRHEFINTAWECFAPDDSVIEAAGNEAETWDEWVVGVPEKWLAKAEQSDFGTPAFINASFWNKAKHAPIPSIRLCFSDLDGDGVDVHYSINCKIVSSPNRFQWR